MVNPPQRVDSMPFTAGRHDRSRDPREIYTDAQPPLSYIPEKGSSLNQTSPQGGFDELTRSSGLPSRHQTTGTTDHGQERQSSAYPSVPETAITQNIGASRNAPVFASQPDSQTKEDLRKAVARKFRDEGRTTMSKSEFDRAVDEAWQKASRNPYSSTSQPDSQINPTKEDLRKAVARKFQNEGRTTMSKSEFDRAVDEAWQRFQPRQTYGQAASPPYPKYVEQPSTTDNCGFNIPATAGPQPDASYPQYQYRR
jgi:hypothetical protein